MYSLHEEIQENDPRQIKWAKQREERGFDDTELWNLDNTIAQFILPRLKAFREHIVSYPGTLTLKEWESVLDEMIDGFESILTDNCFMINEKSQKGIKLFCEYYFHLWN